MQTIQTSRPIQGAVHAERLPLGQWALTPAGAPCCRVTGNHLCSYDGEEEEFFIVVHEHGLAYHSLECFGDTLVTPVARGWSLTLTQM